jgi:hypothetical protein
MAGKGAFEPLFHLVNLRILSFAMIPGAGCGGDGAADRSAQPSISQAHVHEVRLALLVDGWAVALTVGHEDSGWDHYADWWRITDSSGRELARRVLRHPHIGEQPFTRSLTAVQLPPESGPFVVQAHCSVHGTGGRVVVVDLERNQGPGYTIER